MLRRAWASAARLQSSLGQGPALRSLCTAAEDASLPPPPKLFALPPISPRKERIREHGLVALTADFIRQRHAQQQGTVAKPDASFRVQNYTVPLDRPAEFAVTQVYGYGRTRSKWLAAEVGVFGHSKLSRMRESQRAYIRRALQGACIAYDDPAKAAGAALKKEIGLNIQRLKDIRCYRGIRHIDRQPCRGQRTKGNSAQTRKRMGNNY